MYVIHDSFRCKPGQSRALADKLKKNIEVMEKVGGFRAARVLIDAVAQYWTVILEMEVEDLATYEKNMNDHGSRPEFREAMKGYMDLVETGRREIYKVA
jgi:hypothetical protein